MKNIKYLLSVQVQIFHFAPTKTTSLSFPIILANKIAKRKSSELE